jgi:subtilisin family serine protease
VGSGACLHLHAPSSLVGGRPAPAPLPSRCAIGGGACLSEGAGPRCSAALPSAAAAAAAAAVVLLAARAGRIAQAAGAGRWEAARPRTQAVAKFPRRAYRVARLSATSDRSGKGSGIFNLEKKSISFPLSSFSLRVAGGGSCKLGYGGSIVRGPGFGEPLDSGAEAPIVQAC